MRLSRMFETYGKDFAFVIKQPEANVLTLVDTDHGERFLTGIHFVNRIGYYVIDPPLDEDREFAWDEIDQLVEGEHWLPGMPDTQETTDFLKSIASE